MFDKSISVVIPVYNEFEVIERTLLYSLTVLSEVVYDFEIIVVNDGSNDGTDIILNRLSAANNRIRVFHNKKNEGSGASLWKGFKCATKELVLSNFADRPFDLADLREVLPLFHKDDIDFVIVVRKDRSANNLYRKVTSYANYLLIRTLFNIKIDDFQFVQMYKREVFNGINIISRGTFVPPEIIIRLIHLKRRYKQVKCIFHKRNEGKSKCGSPKNILNAIKEIVIFKLLTLFRFIIL